MPESITAFLKPDGVEDAIRKAISLGGDTDTMGCIARAMGEAYYGGVPAEIIEEIVQRIPGFYGR